MYTHTIPDNVCHKKWGIYVTNTKNEKYTDMILDGFKTIETRDNRKLDKFVGKIVGLIRHNSKGNKLVGYILIGEPKIYNNYSEWCSDYCWHRVPKDSKYAFKDKIKYGYPLYVIEDLRGSNIKLPSSFLFYERCARTIKEVS